MGYYIPKRRKIRGWKRRVKQVDRWGDLIKQPNTEWFKRESTKHMYERCFLSPFYLAEKRHPPLWFYKRIISKFITAYEAWAKDLTKLEMPFDLMLWIYDPAFIRSEIISWKVEEAGQQKRFVWESESESDKSFPYQRFDSPLYDLHQFEWTLADDENIHFEDDFEDADFTAADLLAGGYIKKVQGSGEVYYAKRLGDIWIGRYKSKVDIGVRNTTQDYFAPPR
jgi:hypothetical protein